MFGVDGWATRLAVGRILAKMAQTEAWRECRSARMKCLSAKDAKYGFGRMIDLARAAPVLIEKHGRPVVVVMAIEEFERLKRLEGSSGMRSRVRKTKDET